MVHLSPSAWAVFTSLFISSFSTQGSVGEAGIRGRYPILLASSCGNSLPQKAEKPGRSSSDGTFNSCDAGAILPSRHTCSIGSVVTQGRQIFNVFDATEGPGILSVLGRYVQGSHYILVVKFKDFSRTFKDPEVDFQGPILDGSLQRGKYYSNI